MLVFRILQVQGWLTASIDNMVSMSMITAVLMATNASKLNARKPKVMFILQSPSR
jgi:hypothetical protein